MNKTFSALLAPTPIECAASHHVGWHGKDQPCQGRGLFVGWCSSWQFFLAWLWCRWQLFCKALIWTKHSFHKSRNLSLLWCLPRVVVTECDTWEGCCCFLPFIFACCLFCSVGLTAAATIRTILCGLKAVSSLIGMAFSYGPRWFHVKK